jgi:hypothetical protein
VLNKSVTFGKKYIGKYLNLLGVKTWPTKRYEIWLFIQFILYKSKPTVVAEFGSGRSTHYFAEYCQKMDSLFLSIEQNKRYVNINRTGMKNSFLRDNGLYHVPIKGDWFDTKVLDKIKDINNIEFILIDAPGGGGGGSRNSNVGSLYLKSKLGACKVIIVDDFNRSEVKESTRKIVKKWVDTYTAYIFKSESGVPYNETLFLVQNKYKEECDCFIDLMSFDGMISQSDNLW